MAGPFTTPVAKSVPIENKTTDPDNDFEALNVQDGLEEIDFRRETFEPTGFQNLTDSVVTFNEVTREVKIEPAGASYDYYIFGKKFNKTVADTVIIPDTHGLHILYLDNVGSGQFVSYTGAGADKDYDQGQGTGLHEIKVCIIYWDAVNKKGIISGDARSLLSMPWALQRRTHFVTRVEYGSGDFLLEDIITTGDGSLDTHAKFSLTEGKIFNEDALFNVVDSATPTNSFEQTLTPFAKIPIYYRSGAGNTWFKKDASDFPLCDDPGNTIFYNDNPGGIWNLTNAPDNSFVAIYYFATINIKEPIIGVLGHHAGNSPKQAVDVHLLTPAGLPTPAMGFIKAVIFQTSSAYTNTPKARIFASVDVFDTLSNDRYSVNMNYNANANTGRWLETSQGQSSDGQALLIPEDSFIRTVTIQSTADIDIGKKFAFFETNDLVTPIFELTIPVGGLKEHQFDIAEFLTKGDKIAIQVTEGSINKPFVRFWIETTI